MGLDKGKLIRWGFWVVILVSVLLTLNNYVNYIGLLRSTNDVEFAMDSITYDVDGSKLILSISFTLLNPTDYNGLDFQSLQCQVYLDEESGELYLGATGYSPPVNVPLHPDEVRGYTTILTVIANESIIQAVESGSLQLRVRNVIHYSTPLRGFYQTINLNVTAILGN